jgi:hypothetical protein
MFYLLHIISNLKLCGLSGSSKNNLKLYRIPILCSSLKNLKDDFPNKNNTTKIIANIVPICSLIFKFLSDINKKDGYSVAAQNNHLFCVQNEEIFVLHRILYVHYISSLFFTQVVLLYIIQRRRKIKINYRPLYYLR